MIPHSSAHLIAGAGLLVAASLLIVVVRNRVIRRRLLFSAVAAVAAIVVHLLAIERPDLWLVDNQSWRIEALLLAISLANAGIALAFNPWFRDGLSDRAPAIVQDTLVAVASIGAGLIIYHVSSYDFLAGSTIVAAVFGFALQNTLANAFAGVAIQTERPFRVGHWITVANWEGVVTEVTWRATKIRTKAGNLVAVPNSVMANEAINNYSAPTSPTRLSVDVGATYGAPPDDVRDALLAAARQARYVLSEPEPEALLLAFADSAITYQTRFWVDDFSKADQAQDAVRTRIYYEFKRRHIEIPWPIQIQYDRVESPADSPERRERFARHVAGVPVLARLPEDAHRALAADARELLYADGEVIVREGDAGASLFLVLGGTVAITVGPERREVAVTKAGGYFGEMSLLTGDPRTATVVSRGHCTVLEITADAFRDYVQRRPEVIDELAAAAGARRKELDEARARSGGLPVAMAASLRERMREYFGLA